MSDTLFNALALIPALVFAIVFHEVSHGWTALAFGDPTAKERRRLSLNPLRHVDPVGTLIIPGGLALIGAPVFGWAKPVPVDARRLRDPRRDMMIVAAAGPGTNLVLALLGAIGLGLLARFTTDAAQPGTALLFLAANLQNFIALNIFLAVFNLLPVPPFDGSHIVEGLLPERAAMAYARARPYGLPIMILLLFVLPQIAPNLHIVDRLIFPPVQWLGSWYQSIAQAVAGPEMN